MATVVKEQCLVKVQVGDELTFFNDVDYFGPETKTVGLACSGIFSGSENDV